MRHNIKPAVAALLIPILQTTKQAVGGLRIRDRMCFGGVICEAYRQAHPDDSGWLNHKPSSSQGFLAQGVRDGRRIVEHDIEEPPKLVLEWATVNGKRVVFEDTRSGRVFLSYALNDDGWSFSRFIEELQNM